MATAMCLPRVLLLLFPLQLLCLCFLQVYASACQDGRFGDRCQLQCHCNGTCHNGLCSQGCSPGFYGPTCQQQNVASSKRTNASSVFQGSWDSRYAVDGDARNEPDSRGITYLCYHSADNPSNSWWYVDLGDVYPMNNITIYYRQETLYRFTGAKINIANNTGTESLCTTIPDATTYQQGVARLSCPQSGQRLILRQDGPCGRHITYNRHYLPADCMLELCEVQILVCTNGTYGHDCSGQCGHCSDIANCHHVNGSCLSGICQPGYKGDKCDQNCNNGTYGQNCSNQCSPHCSGDASCHHVTGSCLSGSCQPGYRGDRCDQTFTERPTTVPGATYVHPTMPDNVEASPTVESAVAKLVAGTVTAAVAVVVLVIIIAIVCYRRRASGGGEKSAYPERNERDQNEEGRVYVNEAFNRDSPRSSISTRSRGPEDESTNEITANVYANVGAVPGLTEANSPSSVAVSDLEKVVATKKSRGAFQAEYKSVPSSFLADYDVSRKTEHAKKNKFREYYPYDFNRVVLEPRPDDPNSDYINASFIDGLEKKRLYIASQAPTPVTLSDFLRMIWQQKCDHVVMLTNLMEDMKVKCVRYWPEAEGEEMKCGEVTVTLRQTTEWSYCTLRVLILTHESGGSLSVKQFHFTTWPDHGVPSHVDMLDLFWKVHASWTPDSGPLLVHCSAGVGRTGTFIALCILSDQAAKQRRVDPLTTLSALRHQRRNMIQTLAQYEFLHEALVRVVQLGRTAVDKQVFCSHFPSKKGGLLVGNCTLDQLAQDLPRLGDKKENATTSEPSAYSNVKDWDYFQRSLLVSSTSSKQGFEMVKLSRGATDPLAPTGLWKFVRETQACVLVDLHQEQNLVHESSQEKDGRVDVVWGMLCSLEAGLTSRHLTLRSQDSPDVELEYIALDLSRAEMPGCVAKAASRLTALQLSTSCPVVLLYRPSEESCAQLLCAAVNLAESLRLDGHVELVNSLLRLHTTLDKGLVQRLAEVAYAILHDDTSVYSNEC